MKAQDKWFKRCEESDEIKELLAEGYTDDELPWWHHALRYLNSEAEETEASDWESDYMEEEWKDDWNKWYNELETVELVHSDGFHRLEAQKDLNDGRIYMVFMTGGYTGIIRKISK